jgi:uncharacterized protein YyaL (SSP411 family)
MIELFADPDRAGFFQVGSDAEQLVVRPKDVFDNAVPSGNSVAAEVLLRLALLTGDAEYERRGTSALRLVRDLASRAPTGFGHALSAIDLYLGPAREVAVVGDLASEQARALVDVVWQRYAPNLVLAASAPGDADAAEVVPLLAGRTSLNGSPAAYVCERFSCQRPTADAAELAASLGGPLPSA